MRQVLVIAVLLISSSIIYADTLYEAVQHGMIANPDILGNVAKGLSSKQGEDKAKGAYYPTVDFNGGFGRERSLNPTTTAIDDTNVAILNRTESSIEFKQNLYSGGGIINEVKRNQFITQSQLWKTKAAAEDLALEITKDYLAVITNERLYAFSKSNLVEHRSLFKMIKERADAGIARQAELEQAVARLALAESNKISAQASLHDVRINYAKAVGKWPEHLIWPLAPGNKEIPSILAKIVEKGLDNNPGIKSTYADIKQAKAQYKVARAAYYPKVDLVFSASKNRNIGGLIGPNNSDLAAIRMNYNAFRGGSDLANIRQTAYQVQESYEAKNKALIQLKEAIRLSWNSYISTTKRLRPLKLHVSASKKTRIAYQDEFKVGKRTLLDLLDSQNELYQAELELARGTNDEMLSRYRLMNGMGQLMKFLRLRIPVNVVNNDVFTSAETHILLNKKMNEIPYPAEKERLMLLKQPVKNMETTPLTRAIIDKNTTYPKQVMPKLWYVSAGVFNNENNAIVLVNRLRGLGFSTFISPCGGRFKVLVGPYEYRGHAGNGMERLKELAHVQGVLITFEKAPGTT